jgi:hypothetical protein
VVPRLPRGRGLGNQQHDVAERWQMRLVSACGSNLRLKQCCACGFDLCCSPPTYPASAISAAMPFSHLPGPVELNYAANHLKLAVQMLGQSRDTHLTSDTGPTAFAGTSGTSPCCRPASPRTPQGHTSSDGCLSCRSCQQHSSMRPGRRQQQRWLQLVLC